MSNENEIAIQEHDGVYDVKKTSQFMDNGDGTLVRQHVGTYATQIQIDSVDVNVQYIGRAVLGSLTSAPVWQIQKLNENTGTVITWADGDNAFDNIWDNRELLSYS